MGTRGFWGVRDNGRLRTTYNHFDSYPTGLGVSMVEFIQGTDMSTLGAKVFDLTLVEEQDSPTPEQMEALVKAGTWENVSTGGDWYSALRGTQGEPEKMIESGFWMGQGFDPTQASDSWLEWGYLIDLDAGELLVYDIAYEKDPVIRRRIPFADLVGVNANEIMSAIESED